MPEEPITITLYDQLHLALDYARRTETRMTCPLFLMDREMNKLFKTPVETARAD